MKRGTAGRSHQVQSVQRALHLLELMSSTGDACALSQLSAQADLPQPTTHRLLKTMLELGYVRQDSLRSYALGPRLVRLGESAVSGLGAATRPTLDRLVAQVGESANLAMLQDDQIVYVAHVASTRSMRTFTEVGSRVSLHSTGVGKAILATMEPSGVRALLARTGLDPRTTKTVTSSEALLAQLRQIAATGFAVDDEEQEAGVRCIAVPIPGGPPRFALSVSGPSSRLTADTVRKAVPVLQQAARAIAAQLGSPADT